MSEWDEFKQGTSWQELLDEISDVLQRLEMYCRINERSMLLDPSMRNLMEAAIAVYKRIKTCLDSQGRPAPDFAEDVFAITRKVRRALPL